MVSAGARTQDPASERSSDAWRSLARASTALMEAIPSLWLLTSTGCSAGRTLRLVNRAAGSRWRLSHLSQNRTLPGSKYVSRQRLILKLSAEIPVGFDCATAMPRACDNSKTASSRSGAGTDAEAVRRNPRIGARCMIFPIAAGFARNTWTSCTLICSNGNVAIQAF